MSARMRISLLILGLGLLVTEPTAAQRLYSWRDGQGVIHYSSHPPAQAAKQVDELTIDGQGQLSALSERERLYARQQAAPLDAEDSQRRETCGYYRSLLARYQSQGATAFNPLTGKTEQLRDKAATQAVQQARYAVTLYCPR